MAKKASSASGLTQQQQVDAACEDLGYAEPAAIAKWIKDKWKDEIPEATIVGKRSAWAKAEHEAGRTPEGYKPRNTSKSEAQNVKSGVAVAAAPPAVSMTDFVEALQLLKGLQGQAKTKEKLLAYLDDARKLTSNFSASDIEKLLNLI